MQVVPTETRLLMAYDMTHKLIEQRPMQRLLNNNQTPVRNETRQSITGSCAEVILLLSPLVFLQCRSNKSSTCKIEPHLIKFGELWKNKFFWGWHFFLFLGFLIWESRSSGRVFLFHFVLNYLRQSEQFYHVRCLRVLFF